MAKKKPWETVFRRIRVIYRANWRYPPRTTAVDLDDAEKELGFQFPVSYRAFAEQFGLGGTLMCPLPEILPLTQPSWREESDWLSSVVDATRFYHTFDWFADYWRHFGHDGKMRVLLIRAAGTPIGIVPLCVRTERYQVGNLRVLTYPLADWGTWYGPIGANPSASLFMAMQHVRATRRDWDLIELRWTGACSFQSNGSITERAMRVAGFQPRKRVYQQVSLVDLEGGWESYLASKSSKWRQELRRGSSR